MKRTSGGKRRVVKKQPGPRQTALADGLGKTWTYDPQTVLRDALNFTPWTDTKGSLPQRGEWSTYRLASKDIILSIAVHRFHPSLRYLDVRSFYAGEHPLFEELEGARGMTAMLLSQAYQSGRTLRLHFEGGVPYEIRLLLERATRRTLDVNETEISHAIGKELLLAIARFEPDTIIPLLCEQSQSDINIAFNVLRGLWSVEEVETLLLRRVPLSWIFGNVPHPLKFPGRAEILFSELRLLLLEELALHRLEERPFGESFGRRVERVGREPWPIYRCADPIRLNAEDASVDIPALQPFRIRPVPLPNPGVNPSHYLQTGSAEPEVLCFPLDLRDELAGQKCEQHLRDRGISFLLVSKSMSQLREEAQWRLDRTLTQLDDDELDEAYVDRYTD